MLNIIFGRRNAGELGEDYILDNRDYFNNRSRKYKFEDNFVKTFIKKIDRADVIMEGALKDEAGYYISVRELSSGCKTLCCLYFDGDKHAFYGALGDNCVPFLMDIARERDITVVLEHYMTIPTEYFDEGLVCHNGKVLEEFDFDVAYSEWCEEETELARKRDEKEPWRLV